MNTGRAGLLAINPDGSPDLDFYPGRFAGSWYFPTFYGAAVQPDGKLVLGGLFKLETDPERWNLVRLLPGDQVFTEARFERILLDPNGSVRLTIHFEGSQYYVLEASSNLQSWTPLYTNTQQRVLIGYTDAEASAHSNRFYRVRPWN